MRKDIEGANHEKQGTVWSATAHIVAAVIGSGVLALAWSVAQFGWIVGPVVLLGFSCVTYYTSTLLANCYRYPDPIDGVINHAYIDAVRSYLDALHFFLSFFATILLIYLQISLTSKFVSYQGPRQVFFCGWAQYINLWGTLVGYTITAATSMIAVQRSNCYHRNGHGAKCTVSGSMLMLAFGIIQVVLSQLPSLENITWLSVVAVATSFGYSFIGLGLCIAKWISHGETRGTIAGATGVSTGDRAWNFLLALGNIAFAYTFADVLIEIQSTLKSPPAENKTMKKAVFYGIGLTTIFYLSLGCIGYAAFGNNAPGNILTGFGFYEPFWLVDVANICIIIHLAGAYQVYAQPIFARFEDQLSSRWPEAKFIHRIYSVRVPFTEIGPLSFTLSKLVLRTIFILFTTLVAMLLPFFNAVLGLIGALGFWPLSVYFPVSMHISQTKIRTGAPKWFWLQGLSLVCMLISIGASIGSVADIISNLKNAAPFKLVY